MENQVPPKTLLLGLKTSYPSACVISFIALLFMHFANI